MDFEIERLGNGPIIAPDMDARMGTNINGPSLIRAPDWLANPLGRYYLYFAHHNGSYIRLAVADTVEGPWRTHEDPFANGVDFVVVETHIGGHFDFGAVFDRFNDAAR